MWRWVTNTIPAFHQLKIELTLCLCSLRFVLIWGERKGVWAIILMLPSNSNVLYIVVIIVIVKFMTLFYVKSMKFYPRQVWNTHLFLFFLSFVFRVLIVEINLNLLNSRKNLIHHVLEDVCCTHYEYQKDVVIKCKLNIEHSEDIIGIFDELQKRFHSVTTLCRSSYSLSHLYSSPSS